MGSLWLAYHLTLRVRVVVKFIAAEFAGNQEAMARFQREAAATMAAKSAHVVQILDYGFTEDLVPFIAMEYLEGEDLAKKIARESRINPWEFAEILKQACKGLTRAHAQGIIHRDIKPENIFLTYVDDELVVKVLDFGIAKADVAAWECPPTWTGMFLGTLFYMSPEQTRGAKSVDHRTDLWSLGVVTYYALTGALPFEGEAIGTLVEQITVSDIREPSQRFSALGPAIDAWMSRALSRDVNQRFGSAKDMAVAFEAAVAQLAPWPEVINSENPRGKSKGHKVANSGVTGRHYGLATPLGEGSQRTTLPRVSATTPSPLSHGFTSSPSLTNHTPPAMSGPARPTGGDSLNQATDMTNKRNRTLFIGIGIGVGVVLGLATVWGLQSKPTTDRASATTSDHRTIETTGAPVRPAPAPSPAIVPTQPSVPVPTPAPLPLPAPTVARNTAQPSGPTGDPSASVSASKTKAAPVAGHRKSGTKSPTGHSGDNNPFDGTY